jgi:Family of unknown function (DUF5947)
VNDPRPLEQDGAFATLRQFVRKRADVERCELCSNALAANHQHLIEPIQRKLVCACDPCTILFSQQAGLKYKRVPRRVRWLPNFRMSDGQWEALRIPIEMAFFFYSSPQGRVAAFYPSPAGATESLLPLESWNEISQENPELSGMEADVEALLVNRVGSVKRGEGAIYSIAPIDECYRLVGLIRTYWKGFGGGTEVWQEIEKFFAELKMKAGVKEEEQSHA